VSPKLKKEMAHFDPRGIYFWDEVAYIRNSNAKVWFEDLNTHFSINEKKMIQSDGYKVFLTPRWKNRFKRSNWKYRISPGGCTDASTSPVDENVGQSFKKKFFKKIEDIRNSDPEMNNKFDSEGIGFLRIQITKIACDVWDDMRNDKMIPLAFKKCGLCNDKWGRENYYIGCQNLLTYQAPTIDYQYKKKPYTKKQIEKMVEKEMKAHSSQRKRKRIELKHKRYLRNLQKSQN
jgi:hypothetical protein